MKDYHDLFLKCDGLLLADVFEKFRNNSLKNYGLCPSHQLIAPGLSWDAMLTMTKIKLELILDPDMPIFFEKSTRGGISYISNRQCILNTISLNRQRLISIIKAFIFNEIVTNALPIVTSSQ